jgi:hypothetical protein
MFTASVSQPKCRSELDDSEWLAYPKKSRPRRFRGKEIVDLADFRHSFPKPSNWIWLTASTRAELGVSNIVLMYSLSANSREVPNMARMSGVRGGVLKVVLIVVGVVALIAVCAGIFVALHWKGWVANLAFTASQQMVKESGLPQDQKDSILSEVRQLGDDFSSGKISGQEMAKIVKAIGDGPLLRVATVQGASARYIDSSEMTPGEKKVAILSLQRFARGVYENKIPKEKVDVIVKPVSDPLPNGQWKLKSSPSRMEVDQFVADARTEADKTKIPDEPFELNVADELKKVIHGVS